jgi:hypothetical protein
VPLRQQTRKSLTTKSKKTKQKLKKFVKQLKAARSSKRSRLKKRKVLKPKRKQLLLKAQVKDTTSAEKTAENFEQKYRKKPGTS